MKMQCFIKTRSKGRWEEGIFVRCHGICSVILVGDGVTAQNQQIIVEIHSGMPEA